MKNSILFFLFLIPAFLFAQYPNTGNKARLGYQTTGDGLIWRGVAADTSIKPRVIAHAYFQLDTVNGVLRRYIATRGSWQVVGGGSSTDSTVYATRYWANSNFFPLEGGTLTGTGGAGFIGFPSQVSAPGTPVSGLNVYAQGSSFNWKGTDGHERQFGGTLTGGRSYTLPDINGTLALGTGTADRLARWTAANTLATGNLSDNGTRLAALLPWQFQTYTTAGLPTGITGYHVYNTTTNGPGWYQGSRWAYGLESTFNRGTATRIPFFNANGQVTDDDKLRFNNTTNVLTLAGQLAFNTTTTLKISDINGSDNTGFFRWTNYPDGSNAEKTFMYLYRTGVFGGSVYINPTSQTSNTSYAPTGNNNYVFGGGRSLTTAQRQTLIGYRAGDAITIGNDNTLIGSLAGSSIITGTNNVHLTSGVTAIVTGDLSNTLILGSAVNGGVAITSSNSTIFSGVFSNFYFGGFKNQFIPSAFTPAIVNLNATGGSGTDVPGQSIRVNGGIGAGAGVGGDVIFGTATNLTSGTTAQTITSRWFVKGNTGYMSNSSTANYLFDVTSTNAFGLPRGTVAQRPTIVTSTTPFRYNTDSTALEYGESVGTWRLLATRAYARSLVSAIPASNIYTANGSLTADRIVTGGGNSLEFSGLSTFKVSQSSGDAQILISQSGGSGTATLVYEDVTNSRYYFPRFNIPNNVFYDQYFGDVYPAGTSTHYPIMQNGYTGNVAIKSFAGITIAETVDTFTRLDVRLSGFLWRATSSNITNYAIKGNNVSRRESGSFGTTNIGLYANAENATIANTAIYVNNGEVQFSKHGLGNKEAADLSKTQSNYIAGFATDGTVLDLERKRDTTIYVIDTDYDFSAALTTTHVGNRYNRVIFLMTTTAAAGSDSELTLHTPDANLMQVEYLVRSTDEAGGFANKIVFGTNNAVDSTNGLVTNYFPAAGQGVGIRAGLRSAAYKYFYY